MNKRRPFTTSAYLFGVLEVLEEGLLAPGDALVDVGSGVRKAFGFAGVATEHTEHVVSQSDDDAGGANRCLRTHASWGRLYEGRRLRGCGIAHNEF